MAGVVSHPIQAVSTGSRARAIAGRALSPIARALASAGVSADGVTGAALALTLTGAGLLLAGHFAAAAALVALGFLGDALDGVTARQTGTASAGGALFDASADRYQEWAVLGAIALRVHADVRALALVLAALLASFMVSYGSAKAEALRVEVPGGPMRRMERAVCLGLGIAAVPFTSALAARALAPAWVAEAPLLGAVAVVAVVGNVSAVARLRAIATAAGTRERRAAGARVERPTTGPW